MTDPAPATILVSMDVIGGNTFPGVFWGNQFVSARADANIQAFTVNPSIAGVGSITDGPSVDFAFPTSALTLPSGATGGVSSATCSITGLVPVSATRMLVVGRVSRLIGGVGSGGDTVSYTQQAQVVWLVNTALEVVVGPTASYTTFTKTTYNFDAGTTSTTDPTNSGAQVGLFGLVDGSNIRLFGPTAADDDLLSLSTLELTGAGGSAGVEYGCWRDDQVWYYVNGKVQKAVASGARTNTMAFGVVDQIGGADYPVSIALIGADAPIWTARIDNQWLLFESATSNYGFSLGDIPTSVDMVGVSDFSLVTFDGELGISRYTQTVSGCGAIENGVCDASGFAFTPNSGMTKTDDWVNLVDSSSDPDTYVASVGALAQRGFQGTLFVYGSSTGDPDPVLDQLQLTAQVSAVPPYGPIYNLNVVLRSTATQFA